MRRRPSTFDPGVRATWVASAALAVVAATQEAHTVAPTVALLLAPERFREAGLALAAVAGEHLLVLGPPGTAKSQAVRQVARALGGRYFEYLLGRFTEPSELVGPIDLRRLKGLAVGDGQGSNFGGRHGR